MIKTILVEDQAMVREGIATLLRMSGEFEILASASNGKELLEQLQQVHNADIVLMDVRLPDTNGLQLTRELQARSVTTPVLLLTTFDDPQIASMGRQQGAKGYLLKDAKIDQLIAAIHRILNGELVFPAAPQDLRLDNLSGKEMEILKLMVGGANNQQIADFLCLSLGTVKNYNSSIFQKLSVRNRTQAVILARDLGLA